MFAVILYQGRIVFGDMVAEGSLRRPLLYNERPRPDGHGCQANLAPFSMMLPVKSLMLPDVDGWAELVLTDEGKVAAQKMYEQASQNLRAAESGIVLSDVIPTVPKVRLS